MENQKVIEKIVEIQGVERLRVIEVQGQFGAVGYVNEVLDFKERGLHKSEDTYWGALYEEVIEEEIKALGATPVSRENDKNGLFLGNVWPYAAVSVPALKFINKESKTTIVESLKKMLNELIETPSYKIEEEYAEKL